MSQNRNTILIVGATAIAWGGFAAWRVLHKPERPDSPVAIETAQEKADSVQAAFARGAAVNDVEVEGFVTRLQAAVREHDTATITGMVAPARMLDGVEAITGKTLPSAARGMLETQLAGELAGFFDDTVVETRVKRIDRDAEGNIVVYLRTIDVDRITMKSRWWLYHDGEGLRWWDGEDLQLGLRISTAMAAGIAAATSPDRAETIKRFLEVIGRLATISMDDPVQVRALVADLDGLTLEGLPASFRHLAIVTRASASAALGDAEDTLRRLDALESEGLQPFDMPVRHYLRASACLALERWSDAEQAIERYLELLGEDAEAYAVLGTAKLGLGDTKAALAAFEQGLADDPGLPDNYGGAAMLTEDIAALAKSVRKAPSDAVLDGAAQWLVDAEDGEGLVRLVEAATKARPSWDASAWGAKAATLGAP